MAYFRKVETQMWEEEKFLELTFDERYIYIYLNTNSRITSSGCYVISYPVMTFHTGFQKEKIISILDSLAKKQVILMDDNTKEILVLDWLKTNFNGGTKNTINVERSILDIKSPDLQRAAKDLIDEYKDKVQKTPEDGSIDDFQAEVADGKKMEEVLAYKKFEEEVTIRWTDFTAKYAHISKIHLPLSAERKRHLKRRFKEPAFDFKLILEKVEESNFLMGRAKVASPFCVTFDWIIKSPQNYMKIIEGNYRNRQGGGSKVLNSGGQYDEIGK